MRCSITHTLGDAEWQLYRIKLVKYLGEIGGESIYACESAQRLPSIVTYDARQVYDLPRPVPLQSLGSQTRLRSETA